MSTYVLIHGSWHGAWCWYKIIPLLEQAGHKGIALDLPGHGRDWSAASEVSLQSYVESVCNTLDAQAEPVILVGHSRGGIVISQAAEHRPEKIRTLVYLAAFLIPHGEAMLPTALSDSESLIVSNMAVNEERCSHMLKAEAFREALYADCSEEDVTLATALLTPEPNAPVATPMHITQEHFGRVPRVYIETLRDRGVSPSLQKKMYTALPCQRVMSMETSHSPFFSAPQELVRHLTSLVPVNEELRTARG